MIKYDNYKTLLNKQDQIVSYQGKIYDSNYGYVDVSTLTPLAYNEDATRKPEGEVKFEGESSSVTVKYAYDNRVRVEIDSNKDGTVDDVQVYQAGNYEQEIPNAAPVISISFPQSIYTDTDISAVKVNVYDPDLDGFTVTNQWQINGVNKGTDLALDNALFAKHDMLKLTVTAEDDRVGDVKTSVEVKEQEVLNSRPIINASFEKLQLTIGDTSTLEYTVSDADNDDINISWKHYFINDFYGGETIYEYYHPEFTSDCELAIEDYDMQHPNAGYDTLSDSKKEDFNRTYCLGDIPGQVVNFNFVKGKIFDAIAPGLYFHELIASDGDYNRSKVFDSNISKTDIIERQVNNHDQYSTSSTYNIYMKDFNNDGNKDLIYMGSVTKHDPGSTMTEPDGEVITFEPFDYSVPVIVIEYRNGDSVLEKKTYEINYVDLDDFYVNDLDGDGKLDVLLTYTNHYSPPTNKKFGVMLQNANGTLNPVIEKDLVNHDALAIYDVTGDGSEDLILNATDGFTDFGIQIYNEEGNQTMPISLPNSLGSSGVKRKILTSDLDGNGKQDIIVVNKNFANDGKLNFLCSVLFQNSDGNFTEKIYEKTLGENLTEYEYITDMKISDLGDMHNMFIVTTTKHIYLLSLDNNTVEIINTLNYIKDKNKNTTRVLNPVDINHDGKKDLIVIDTSSSADRLMGISIQRDNLDFLVEQDYSFENGYSTFTNPSYVLGDINNDGKYEIFFSTGEENLSAIYFK